MAKMGELKRAAQTLGVTSSTLRQHGWKTAAPARVQAALDDRPDWLTAARESDRNRFAKHQRRRAGQGAASRLGIQLRAVKERGVGADDVEDLLAAQPDWLVAEQRRRQAQVEREAADTLHRQLADTLIASVHEVWFQELMRATTDDDVDAIDARWAPEVNRAKREARRLIDELTPQRVRARIDREGHAARDAARYRATQLVQRALGIDAGG